MILVRPTPWNSNQGQAPGQTGLPNSLQEQPLPLHAGQSPARTRLGSGLPEFQLDKRRSRKGVPGKPKPVPRSWLIIIHLIGDSTVDPGLDPLQPLRKLERKIGPVQLDPVARGRSSRPVDSLGRLDQHPWNDKRRKRKLRKSASFESERPPLLGRITARQIVSPADRSKDRREDRPTREPNPGPIPRRRFPGQAPVRLAPDRPLLPRS